MSSEIKAKPYTDEELAKFRSPLYGGQGAATRWLATLEAEHTERMRERSKWWDYEQEFILPCFKWAEEMGIDLRDLVATTPGRNCVDLLVHALMERLRHTPIGHGG